MSDMNPGQLKTSFLADFNRLKNRLENAGLWADVQKKLHDPRTIEVKANRTFTHGHRTAFALRIGDSVGKVWACIDGSVIDEEGYSSTLAQDIDIATKRRTKLCKQNTWPEAFKRDVYGPLGSEHLALVRFDIARWAVLRQSNHISYGDIIQPDFEDLAQALRKYRLTDFGNRPSTAGVPLPFKPYVFRRMSSKSVLKDNSGAKATGRTIDPQQSDEQRIERIPSDAGKNESSDEPNAANDIQEAMFEDDAAVDADPLPPYSRDELDPDSEVEPASSEDDAATDSDPLPLRSTEHVVRRKTLRSAQAAKYAKETGLAELGDASRETLHNIGEISSSVHGSDDNSESSSDSLATSKGGSPEGVENNDLEFNDLLNRYRRSEAPGISSPSALSSSPPALPSSHGPSALTASASTQQNHRRKPRVSPAHVSQSKRRPNHVARPKTRTQELLQELGDMAEVSRGLAESDTRQFSDPLEMLKERRTRLDRRIDHEFARGDRGDEILREILEIEARKAAGQTGTGGENDEAEVEQDGLGEKMLEQSNGNADNYIGE